MKNDPSKFLRDQAAEAIMDAEIAYQARWAEDAYRHLQRTLYHRVANLIDPKDGERIVDIGTGTGYQLLCLAHKNPKGIYIGTERTPANVIAAKTILEQQGMGDYFAFLSDSTLEATDEREIFWRQNLASIKAHMTEIRQALSEKLVIISDNILYPASVPLLLEGQKIDGGIMSLPGGSSMRSLEWPYALNEEIGEEESEQRAYDITNQTRTAFYHFMSEHVRPDGRIVVADRGMLQADLSIEEATLTLVQRRMGDLSKYWKPIGGGFMPLDMEATSVALKVMTPDNKTAQPSEVSTGHKIGVFFGRLDRNDVPFDEKPLPRPKGV